jgi:hypothetical protein
MKTELKKNVYWLIAIVIVIGFFAVMAHLIETDFGKVDVGTIKFSDHNGDIIAAKLYRPIDATAKNPMPGVLNMHGYQNDKDVSSSLSIELSRRGYVVLAPDTLGHGDSGGYLDILKYFADMKNNDPYSAGMLDAFQYLKSLPFVDKARLGVGGHSLGAMNSERIGNNDPDVRAADYLCGFGPRNHRLKNVLVTQAQFDEFGIFREGKPNVLKLTNDPERCANFGVCPVQWDTTYGNFADGTARRIALIPFEHHLLPLFRKAVGEGVEWMNLALKEGKHDKYYLPPNNQIFMVKEVFGGFTLLLTLVSLIPLTNILLATKYFAPVAQPIPNRYVPKKSTWWWFATTNTLVAGITFPFLANYGSIMDKIEAIIPVFRMQMANGLMVWFLGNAILGAFFFWLWYRSANKNAGVTMYDVGVSFDKTKTIIDWKIIGKTLLLGVILFFWMYLLEGIFQFFTGQEFRFVWPFMRQFGRPDRVGYFFLYIIPALLFCLINLGILLFGQFRLPEQKTPAKTQWVWWVKNLFAGLAGLFLIWVFQYLPFWLGIGPGFEAIGLMSIQGIWMLMLFVYLPEFAILFWFLTWFYRRTGRIYLGSLTLASLITWFLAAGSLINLMGYSAH